MSFPEEVLLAEEDQNAEEKSPLDGAWYKRKQNNPGKKRTRGTGIWCTMVVYNKPE